MTLQELAEKGLISEEWLGSCYEFIITHKGSYELEEVITTLKKEERKLLTYSLESDACCFNDDEFIGTLAECEECATDCGYELGIDAQIALIELDSDGGASFTHDLEYECEF